jgi:hypothetical protein
VEIVVVLFPFLIQRFREMEYLMLGLATGAPCIVFPLVFDDTVGFFLPKTLDHFFRWSFFCTLCEMCSIHVQTCMPYMAQILHVPYSCLDFNLTNLQIVVCSGGCKTAVVPMALVQGVTPT